MRRDAQAILLLALAVGLVKLSLTGTATRYVGAGMVPLLLFTAVLIAVLAGFALVTQHAPDSPEVDPTGSARLGWWLLMPIAAALVVAPPSLGVDQTARYGTVLARYIPADATELEPLAEGEPVRLPLIEYAARAVTDGGSSLAGRRVLLEGFVIPGVAGRPYLARLVVSCCAADARPVKIGLVGSVPAGLRAGEWIMVEGGYTDRVDRDLLSGDPIPYVEVSAVRRIDPPTHPYEQG